MSRAKALVTLAVDPEARDRWRRLCAANWQLFADRHGYDVICLDAPLDTSERAQGRAGSWQKCLIPGLSFAERYERIVLLDADVLINPEAPDPAASVPPHRVGAVDAYGGPTPERHRHTLARLYRYWEDRGLAFVRQETPADFYAARGLPSRFDRVVQTGVMVLSPPHHRATFERAYFRDLPTPAGDDEMAALSWQLLAAGCVHWLDPAFNVSWPLHKCERYPFLFSHPDHPRARECATRALAESHFLRFTGQPREMALVDTAPRALAAAPPGPASSAITVEDSPPTAADFQVTTPVALFLFNRPETTRRVFEVIRKVRPTRLLLIADGARGDEPGEAAACAAARAAAGPVDWPCEVRTCYSDAHLGVKRRFDRGLAWAFGLCEEVIVLEDDCLPEPTFFRYCQELLDRYRQDRRIMAVCGNGFQYGLRSGPDTYYFSRYPHVWGWATWRRAWALYDPQMTRWPEMRDRGWLPAVLQDGVATAYWSHILEGNYTTLANWDYAWTFACWVHQGLSILPRRALVSNIGFGASATHTRRYHLEFADLSTEGVRFPLLHPHEVVRDQQADQFAEEILFSGMLSQVFRRVRKAIR